MWWGNIWCLWPKFILRHQYHQAMSIILQDGTAVTTMVTRPIHIWPHRLAMPLGHSSSFSSLYIWVLLNGGQKIIALIKIELIDFVKMSVLPWSSFTGVFRNRTLLIDCLNSRTFPSVQRYNIFSRYANKNTDSALTWSAVFQLQSYYFFLNYTSFWLIILLFLLYWWHNLQVSRTRR